MQAIIDSIDINSRDYAEEGFKYLSILDDVMENKCPTASYQSRMYTAILAELAFRIMNIRQETHGSSKEETMEKLMEIISLGLEVYNTRRVPGKGANDE